MTRIFESRDGRMVPAWRWRVAIGGRRRSPRCGGCFRAARTGATVGAVAAHLSTSAGAVVGLTGSSPLVVNVRDGLRQAGTRNIKTKTYWIPGRTGLD
jgi:hypothetical protein